MKFPASIMAALLAATVAGCAVMEKNPAEATQAEGCRLLHTSEPTGPTVARLYHYRADTPVGKPPPSSVSAKGGSATRTYVTRRHITEGIDNPFGGRSALIIALVTLLIVAGFVGLVGFSIAVSKQPNKKRGFVLLGWAGGLTLAAGISGHLAGSVITIDNPSQVDLEVTVNGEVLKIPKDSFLNVRIAGATLEVDTRAAGQLVEHVTLHLDKGVGDTIRRDLFGNGRFAYPVCGLNAYFLETAHYHK